MLVLLKSSSANFCFKFWESACIRINPRRATDINMAKEHVKQKVIPISYENDPAKFVSGNKALAYTQTYSVESVLRHFQLPVSVRQACICVHVMRCYCLSSTVAYNALAAPSKC